MPTSKSAPRPRRGPGRPPSNAAGSGREDLLSAARQLMAERGLPRVTLREVARRAGVQPALVNYHFGGKSGLLQAVTESVSLELRERVRRAVAAEGTTPERLAVLIRGMIGALAADPYAPRLLFDQILFSDPEVIDRFADNVARPNFAALAGLVEEGAAKGELREVDPMLFVPALLGCCMFFFLAQPLLKRVFGFDSITPELAERYAESSAQLILEGLAPQGARR